MYERKIVQPGKMSIFTYTATKRKNLTAIQPAQTHSLTLSRFDVSKCLYKYMKEFHCSKPFTRLYSFYR